MRIKAIIALLDSSDPGIREDGRQLLRRVIDESRTASRPSYRSRSAFTFSSRGNITALKRDGGVSRRVPACKLRHDRARLPCICLNDATLNYDVMMRRGIVVTDIFAVTTALLAAHFLRFGVGPPVGDGWLYGPEMCCFSGRLSRWSPSWR